MIPSEFRAGLKYAWTESGVDVPAGHRLELLLFNSSGVFVVVGADGSADMTVSGSETGLWIEGVYKYSLRLEETGVDKTLIREGWVRVLPNLDGETSVDERGHARRTLDAIEAQIEGRASSEEQEVSVNGRTIKLMTLAELIHLRTVYRREVQQEEAIARLGEGKESKRIHRVRFSNV